MTSTASKGEVARKVAAVVRGAIRGGLKPGTFAVKTVDNEVVLLPCEPISMQSDPNPWDEVLPGAA